MLPEIECVTVSVGYGDFLREAMPHNLPHLKRWVIVTEAADEETRAVCRTHNVECFLSQEKGRDGDFSKGRMINRGLAHLGGYDWLLHLDADIALPTDFRAALADADLDPACIYGCDRLNVKGYDAWKRVEAKGLYCRSNPWAVHVARSNTTVGTRVANVSHGYTPIGFFQLWHGGTFPDRRYPQVHGTAARTDVQHALQWDRRKRVLIPELIVWHLESEPARMGANWRGRTTARFAPEADALSPGAAQRGAVSSDY
jgi:hypothetical protein